MKIMCDKECLPVKTAQPAAAASDILWPSKPGRKEPPITAIGVNLYMCLSSPERQVEGDTLHYIYQILQRREQKSWNGVCLCETV